MNPTKVKYTIVSSKNQSHKFKDIVLRMGTTVLDKVSAIKLLGVIFDEHLSFSPQVKSVLQKTWYAAKKLKAAGDFISEGSRRVLASAIVLPHLNYCDSVWGPSCSVKEREKIQRVSNFVAKTILRVLKRTSTKAVNLMLNWIPAQEKREVHAAVVVYKVAHGAAPRYLQEKLISTSSLHHHSTTSSTAGNFYRHHHRTAQFRGCFSHWAPVVWESVPSALKAALSPLAFKRQLLRQKLAAYAAQ